MKVQFKLPSKEKLAEFVYDLRNSFPKENLKDRNNNPCIHINFSDKLIDKMLTSKKLTLQLKKAIAREVKQSKSNKEDLKQFNKQIQYYWDTNVNELFFNEMIRIFSKKYIQKQYLCYPTNKVTGSYLGKNEISLIYDAKVIGVLNQNEFASIVLAEEILHLIYWELWQDLYKIKIHDIDEIFALEGPKWSCWHIAELIPEYLLIENTKFRKLNWNKDDRAKGYRWIPQLRKVLDPVWKDSKNIRDFIIKSHKKVGIKIK